MTIIHATGEILHILADAGVSHDRLHETARQIAAAYNEANEGRGAPEKRLQWEIRRELRRAVRGLSIREFNEAVKQFLEEEEAIAMLTRRANGAGRPAQVYVALENSVFRL